MLSSEETCEDFVSSNYHVTLCYYVKTLWFARVPVDQTVVSLGMLGNETTQTVSDHVDTTLPQVNLIRKLLIM